MCALINSPIPPQAFERVRDRIGLILVTELENQANDFGEYWADDVDVYVERFVKPNVNEKAIVNVTVAKADFDNQSQLQADGTVRYNIDVYHVAETEGEDKTEQGDYLSMVKMQRILGLCRAILQDARYKTLGFAPPFIMRRQVLEMGIAQPNSEDMKSHTMGRLVFEVKMPETTSYVVPENLEGVDSGWQLHETESGYKYVFNA